MIFLPYNRWAGMSGSASCTSVETYVNGRSFSSASISVARVSNIRSEMFARPRTFFRDIFISPINLSQNPPYQGARLGMNLQVTPRRLKDSLRSSDSNKVLSSSAAERYVEALSDITICGSDFRLTNLRNANRNVSVDRFVTTSKCTARVVAQVNRHMYTFSSPLFCRTYNAPVKSTPVTVKGLHHVSSPLEVEQDQGQEMVFHSVFYKLHSGVVKS